MNQVKETVGLRMNPDLKEILEAEAKESEMSLSAYLEKVLLNRKSDPSDIERMKARLFELEVVVLEQAHQLQKRASSNQEQDGISIEQIQEEIMIKEIENRKLKQDKADLMDQMKRIVAERNIAMGMQQNVIPHWMNNANYRIMMQMLEKLCQNFLTIQKKNYCYQHSNWLNTTIVNPCL
jgi:Rad3-related DNA helicase